MQRPAVSSHSSRPWPWASSRAPANRGAPVALSAKHWENSAIARPRCRRGVSSIMASAAVGRNAAFPKAIGITAMAISTSPLLQSAEHARSRHPRAKLHRPIPSPKRRLRLATQLPTGHWSSTSHASSRAMTIPLQASLRAGRCKPPRTRSRGNALWSKARIPVATIESINTGTRGHSHWKPHPFEWCRGSLRSPISP